MSERSVTHATFVIERNYDVPVAKVFKAWSDPKAKAQWFVGPDESVSSDLELDFRVGGHERISAKSGGSATFTYSATYQDIVPDERIVSSYDMYADDIRISVSLATIEFKPDGDGTRLVVTEQGAFLDGLDTVESREQGTNMLLDFLGKALREQPGA